MTSTQRDGRRFAPTAILRQIAASLNLFLVAVFPQCLLDRGFHALINSAGAPEVSAAFF